MTLKKALVAITVVAMLFGMVGVAFASGSTVSTVPFTDVKSTDASFNAISSLYAQGIAKGYADGSFKPAASLTRSEFVAFVVRTMGLDSAATASASYTPNFKDAASIGDWAKGYVNVAQALGLVKGDPAGNFNPNANVTYAEASAILIRATGHDFEVSATGWPLNYLVKAAALGITTGITPVAGASVTRGDMAVMVVNTQGVARIAADQKTALPSFTSPVSETVGYLGINTTTGMVYFNDLGWKPLAANVTIAGVAKASDLANMTVSYLAGSDGKIYYIQATANANLVTGVLYKAVGTAASSTDSTPSVFLKDGSVYPLASTYTYSRNQSGTAPAVGDNVSLVLFNGEVTKITATYQDVTNAKVASISTVAADGSGYNRVVSGSVYFDVTSNTTISLNGAAAKLSDLAANDIVNVTTVGAACQSGLVNSVAITIAATRNTVAGTVDHSTVITNADGTTTTVVTLKKADGTFTDVTWIGGSAPVGTVTIALTSDGKGLFTIGASSSSFYALVTGFSIVTGGTSPVNTITVDNRGTAVTYTVGSNDYSSLAGDIVAITLSGNSIASISSGLTFSTEYKVYAVDATAKTVTLGTGNTTYSFVTDPAIYQQSAAGSFAVSSTYLGLSGLKVGDVVYYTSNAIIREVQ